MNARLQELVRENERLQRELEHFTHAVSHDLRASLRHVNAYVQIIREDLGEQATATLAAHLETVRHAARQMGQQIDGLMELSRLARLELQCAPLDVGALLRELSAAMTPAHRQVAWQLAPDFPLLQGDAALIRQLLTHLLANAIKFTGARPVAEIEVRWQPHADGQCAVTVADNGVGFNPHYRHKLFHAFARLHSAREFEGLGMGLALTRKIVERHGGSVWISAVPQSGCSVSFTLPLAQPDGTA